MKRTFACASLVVLSNVALAQLTTTSQVFDVADVHVSKPGAMENGGLLPGGRFELRGAPMLDLIAVAYGVRPDMVIGGPGWLDSDRFDVIAKAPPETTEATLQIMLQALLADRFKLAIHREDKAMPIFALALGKRGLQLKESSGSDLADCKMGVNDGVRTYACHNMTMAGLAERLRMVAAAYLDQPVIDMTGLKDTYDFTLKWVPKGQLSGGDAAPAARLSIFDAVDKQLGLKLEAQKQQTSVIVVDGVNQKPTENRPGVTRILPPTPTEFEVADVRISKPGTASKGELLPGGRLEVQGMSLKDLIAIAWDVDDDTVTGGPKWLDSDRFDIVAKAGANVPVDTLRLMLRALLVERFKLTIHNEEQPVPVYALVLGKREPKLKQSDGSARSGCKLGAENGMRSYTCQNTTMAQLAEKLRGVAGAYFDHLLVDLTGLKGAYDFSLSWTPRNRFLRGASPAGDTGQLSGTAPVAAEPANDLTVFEAVEKQLGLKVAAQKHPMPVIVIDHVDRTPAEN